MLLTSSLACSQETYSVIHSGAPNFLPGHRSKTHSMAKGHPTSTPHADNRQRPMEGYSLYFGMGIGMGIRGYSGYSGETCRMRRAVRNNCSTRNHLICCLFC